VVYGPTELLESPIDEPGAVSDAVADPLRAILDGHITCSSTLLCFCPGLPVSTPYIAPMVAQSLLEKSNQVGWFDHYDTSI
jgi:hypothetical protein